ncbi:hypothetical protein [Marivirga arenosa]|uniref:Uncharacterized protein n=1 Tax=Marivirga arenosa TaxID=3059076 RepID=A0AA49GCN2_9BACT|nr:hypothetical protein [Marivirga sp. BKB1-2]WKK80182.1 hypothetical protein QYS47_23840 [Marivirga sp. BKB1-2]
MNLSDIENVKTIISESHKEDGDFIENIWFDISNSNLGFTLQKTFEALILILQFMITHDIIYLTGYDSKKQEQISWDGRNGEDELENLKKYLSKFNSKEVKQNPASLDEFKYPGYKWKIEYPINMEKYKL